MQHPPRNAQAAIKGRGSTSHLAGRFESTVSEAVDDGWAVDDSEEFLAPRLRTEVRAEAAGSSVSRKNGPDGGGSQAVNPYRGCEHGFSYGFARPAQAYLN